MATTAGTLEQLILEIAKTLQPLKDLVGQDIFAKLGVPLPRSIAGNGAITNKLSSVAGKAAGLEPKITPLADAIDDENIASIISSGATLITDVAALIAEIKALGDAVGNAAGSLPPAEKNDIENLAANLAVRMLEYTVIAYLDD